MVDTAIAQFIISNLDKILDIAKKTYGNVDAEVQVGLKTAYKDYLTKTRLKYSKSKSFFVRNQPVELYSYYVPTGISCGEKKIQQPSFKNCTEFTKKLVISGTGGSGKSVLMKHLFLNCIEEKLYAPILIELRDLNSYEKNLDDFINETLSIFDFKAEESYVKKAKESGHFCFFFDGFDEINPSVRNKTIKQIQTLSKQFPDCPIFLSSRPDDVLTGLDDFSTFRMMPLSLDEAVSLVAKLPFEEVIKTKFSDDLASGLFEKHKSFLSNPLLLSIMLLTYGENAEIPSKLSIFYNQAYEALFQRHDANKGGYSRKRLTNLDIQDFSKIFSLFCLQTYEKRLFKMSRIQCLEFIKKSILNLQLDAKPDDYLNDLLSAACLLIEDGLDIAFSHRSFQEYFVALQISNSPPEIQIKLINRYWTNMSSDNVMSLLLEINPSLVERELIVPRLEEFFNSIEVKRMVGVTHYLRYLKYFFDSIMVEDDGVYFSFMHSSKEQAKMSMHRIIHTAIRNYADFEFPSRKEYLEGSKKILSKYGKEGKRTEIKTKTLTIKSPILNDLRLTSGHSIIIPTLAFDVYKALKSKHLNTSQSFDVLLGIK